MRTFAFLLLVCFATAVPAQAQIYSWRDASGTLVLSDKPRADSGVMTTYAVPGAALVRTTTKPASTTRATQYDELISQYASEHGVSADLVRAVIQAESNFNRYAVSNKGAMGLMQLMPATARELGVRNPFSPTENIRGGVRYLARLLGQFEQNVELALAAYNAGPGNVERYGTIPPFRETRNYVKKITGAAGEAAVARPAAPPATLMYKWTEMVNGRAVPRFSNVAPRGVSFEIVRY